MSRRLCVLSWESWLETQGIPLVEGLSLRKYSSFSFPLRLPHPPDLLRLHLPQSSLRLVVGSEQMNLPLETSQNFLCSLLLLQVFSLSQEWEMKSL
jgi:hypothetical protein